MDVETEDMTLKQPVKPALKKHPVHGDGYSADYENHSKKKKELVWDEPTIEEHDKLRGTRMKIDEPNTPYAYDSGAESDGSHQKSPSQPQRPTIDFDLLQDKLTDVASNYPSSPSSHASTDDDEKKQKFREMRKQHYNEMELVRKFRHDHPDGPMDLGGGGDDDDEDNDADVE